MRSYTPSSFSRTNEFSINLIDAKAIIIQKNPDKIIISFNSDGGNEKTESIKHDKEKKVI